MAELLGTVVGVVSLGLQVCSGLNTYLDGVQGHREETESTRRRCNYMEALVKQIEDAQQHNSASFSGSGSPSLQPVLTGAQTELSSLRDYLNKVCAEASTPQTTIAQKIEGQKRKLLYPFRRDHLNRLGERLATANKALQTALNLVQIELSLEAGRGLKGLDTTLGSLTHDVAELGLGIQNSFQTSHRVSEEIMLSIQSQAAETSLLLSSSRDTGAALREDVAELKTMLAAIMSPDVREVCQRMRSKPDAMRMMCDLAAAEPGPDPREDAHQHSSLQLRSGKTYLDFQCRCKPRRVRTRRKRQAGPFFLIFEAVAENNHACGCPLADLVDTDKSWSAGISLRALRGLVSVAVATTLSSARGAGGFSISPVFTYAPVRDNSPAFEVVYVLEIASQHASYGVLSRGAYRDLARRAVRTLQAIFRTKRASPFDLDESGHNLLYYASVLLVWQPGMNTFAKETLALLEFLVALGVPRDSADARSWLRELSLDLPRSVALDSGFINAFDLLCPDNMDFNSFELGPVLLQGEGDISTMEYHQWLVTQSKKMPELYEDHPAKAVFMRNHAALSRILDADPPTLDLAATDALNQPVLYHLICWPQGLRTVVDRLGTSVIHQPDRDGESALMYALDRRCPVCVATHPIRDQGLNDRTCSCIEVVKLLLAADCLITSLQDPEWIWAFAAASDRAKHLVVDDLVLRRQRLKEAALARLSPEQIDCMNLSGPSVLDRHTNEVLDLLENDGHDVPFGLNTRTHRHSPTIYHCIAFIRDKSIVVSLADAFYSRGFHEVDAPNARGFTPLMWVRNTDFALWLVQHGASLTSLVPETVGGYTAMHTVLSLAGYCLQQHQHEAHSQIMAATPSAIGEAPYLDACRCWCSLRGCHPYSMLLKGMQRSTRASIQSGDMGTVINALDQFLDNMTASLAALEGGNRGIIPRDLVSTWLRGCTFAALALRHTCCNEGRARHDEEEVEEILEEDAVELRRLETLLVEFEEAVDDSGSSLTEFIQTYWKDKMASVLRDITRQSLTERDAEGARSLGVYLRVDGCEEKCESEDTDSWSDFESDDESAARRVKRYNDSLDLLIR
ncbi:Ankyrin repeat-containing protein [Colletotrichum higginsianum IMI 349063]|uniref:Ankyrin repeat-containing protein n=1 Tax=Colletotrichum higginsianum (strain IMI 349063) TaxID=759273 RepID=A0A1B7YWB3_COLHI|nr:Ankyrin repeat-containing protein [Colletotrichum higginsianum IMI 349063]OBR16345.1 Ankyrin repeat-containing protein [Colletotrichum higginsianum IMI 349063]